MSSASEQSNDNARWLVAGLGNPGAQYEKTRHNIGFEAIHQLGRSAGITGKGETRFNAMVGTGGFAGRSVVLVQPLTYMNLSGEAISRIMAWYKIAPENLLVIYDDVALPFGRLRVRPSGSAGGHNGMKSIIKCLGGNEKFARLRLGVGQPGDSGSHDMVHHVLSRFTPEEAQQMPKILSAAEDAVTMILREGVIPAQNRFNGLEIL